MVPRFSSPLATTTSATADSAGLITRIPARWFSSKPAAWLGSRACLLPVTSSRSPPRTSGEGSLQEAENGKRRHGKENATEEIEEQEPSKEEDAEAEEKED
ncbi:Hypothetical predicted protein [Marmota monax]|uniref:Uncharacterized protein n=1 Tax=Marmota monax TaxID=9995 RepID=A0A5E4CIY3_MARMO|nr:hypothetical protein GHT09_005490 [Marmota monax]VTJ81827.1 Hypothetical predicted protein [Marmota monax]